MKRLTFTLLLCAATLFPLAAQTPNYELAERFSAKKVNQMVF